MTHPTARDLGPGPWWSACAEPERPGDEWTVYAWDCDACVLALRADVMRRPSAPHDLFHTGGGSVRQTISDGLVACLKWRDARGLTPVPG